MTKEKPPIPQGYRDGKQTLELEIPWIVPAAYIRLHDMLTEDMNVLEFGSGGSTLFFSNRVAHVTSIETNIEWFDKLSELTKNRDNVTMLYHPDSDSLLANFPQCKFNCILIDTQERFIKRKILLQKSLPLLIHPKILVLDNYYSRYGYLRIRHKPSFGLTGFKEETYDDKSWVGKGTKIFYSK